METAALENRKPHARSCVTNGNELFATKEPVDGGSMASRRFRDSGPIAGNPLNRTASSVNSGVNLCFVIEFTFHLRKTLHSFEASPCHSGTPAMRSASRYFSRNR